jgi:hypothetical protein
MIILAWNWTIHMAAALEEPPKLPLTQLAQSPLAGNRNLK